VLAVATVAAAETDEVGAAPVGAAGTEGVGAGTGAEACGAMGAAAEAGATADCVAVATAGATDVPGSPPRATSTKPPAQARTPTKRTGRIRRFLARLDTACLLSVLKMG
jgi:hypothetical protein